MSTGPVKKDSPAPRSSKSGEFQPYVPDNSTQEEFTWSAVFLGAILGIIFGASSLYLVLKIGLTVSASIPVAVLSITILRAFSKLFRLRPATILENNIVQTTGSAGESIAFGVGVTMPALMLLGYDIDAVRVMVVSLLGGLLGILMMIPLRRAFIVRLHGKPGEPGKLLYPEGTACAQVLITGEQGGASGVTVLAGLVLAAVHKFLTIGLGKLAEGITYRGWLKAKYSRVAEFSSELAPELLGVGFIIGLRTASIMMAGGVLGYLVLAPAIVWIGDYIPEGILVPPGSKSIRSMSLPEIRSAYLLFIGAGAVATAGIISMVRTLPLIVRSIWAGIKTLRAAKETGGKGLKRTDRDMPMWVVVAGSFSLVAALSFFMAGDVGWKSAILGGLLVVFFGFLFVTVSSRLTGEIGSTSNPISGMTVATLTLTCLIFMQLGMTSPADRVLALSIGAVVCIAASNGGTTSQDLKTGYLLGATPVAQQWAILVGALTSALVIGGTLLLFNNAGTVYSAKNLPRYNVKARLAQLTDLATYEGKSYRVFHPDPSKDRGVPPGKYLVDDNGDIKFLVDPAITGKLTTRDDGSEVKLKFEAPKTQLMGLIVNGTLRGDLNWSLILLGAMIAVTLELCGVSSLAFAVGMYVPLPQTVPIFLGGLIRSFSEWVTERRRVKSGQKDSSSDADSSPGVLLSSGYIAGGTLVGVIVAMLELFPKGKDAVKTPTLPWGHGTPYENWISAGAFLVPLLLLVIGGAGWLFGSSNENKK
jgi:putative OPT family oligopeptide transporter